MRRFERHDPADAASTARKYTPCADIRTNVDDSRGSFGQEPFDQLVLGIPRSLNAD
jgi:hypothetical protein